MSNPTDRGARVLRLHYVPEDEWHGELQAHVSSAGFSGEGSAWFAVDELRSFSAALSRYPLPAEEEVVLESGYWKPGEDALDQVHVSIRLRPFGERGPIVVRIHLAEPAWHGDEPSVGHSVTATFLIYYSDLDRFRQSFCAVLDGRAAEAILEAT